MTVFLRSFCYLFNIYLCPSSIHFYLFKCSCIKLFFLDFPDYLKNEKENKPLLNYISLVLNQFLKANTF